MGGDGGGFRIIYFRPHLLVQDGSGRCASHPHAPGTFPAGADTPSPPPPSSPFLPLGGHAGFEEPRDTGLAQIAGEGGGGGGGGVGNAIPLGKRKEAQNTNQRYMYPRNEPSFVSGSLGQNTQGVEGVSSRMRNGRTAFAVGRRVSGRVPWPRNTLCARSGAF